MINNIIYKKLIEHMAEAVWFGDREEKTIYANPRFCNMLGYTLDEIIGQESYMFWDNESAEKIRQIHNKRRDKWRSSSYTGNLRTKSGKLIPVLSNGTPLPSGWTIGIMTDLSELKKQESIYQTLIENMDEAVWFGDKNEKTVYANPKFCKMLGYTLEEIIGQESYMFWDERTAEKIHKIHNKKRKNGQSSSYTGNLRTKSGELIPVSTNGTITADGGTIGIMTDLSTLREKEKNEKILFNAVKYSTDAIMICDTNGDIVSWNKGAQIIFWYKDTIIGKNVSLLFGKKEVQKVLQSSEIITKYELKWRHKNKTMLDISVTQTPILNSTKTKAVSYLLICRDITDYRKMEEEMILKYQKIREVYQDIGIMQRQSDYMFDLLEIFETHDRDIKSIADFALWSIIALTRVDACVIRYYDEKSEKLKNISSFGFEQWWDGKSAIHYKNSLAEKAVKLDMPLTIVDLNKEPGYQSVWLARKNNLSSLFLIPLKSRGKFIGTLSLYVKSDKKMELFENDFIEKYAKVIQIVLANALS